MTDLLFYSLITLAGLLASCQLTNVLLYQMLQQKQAVQNNPFLSLTTPNIQGLGALTNLQGAGSFIQPFPAINHPNFLLPANLQTYLTTSTYISQETSTAVLTIPLLFGNKPVPTTITRTKTYNVTSTQVHTLTSTVQPTYIQPTPIIITATPTIIAAAAPTVQYAPIPEHNYDLDNAEPSEIDNDVEESILEEKPKRERSQYEYIDDASIVVEERYDDQNGRQELAEETESQKALRLIEARRQKGFERRKPKPTSPPVHSSRSRNTYREPTKRREQEPSKFTRSHHRGSLKNKESTTRNSYYRDSLTTTTTSKPKKVRDGGTRRRNYVRTTTNAPTTTTTTTEAPVYEYDQNYYDYYYPQAQQKVQYKKQEKDYDYSRRQPSWAGSSNQRQPTTPAAASGHRQSYGGNNANVDYYDDSNRKASQQQPQYSPVEQDSYGATYGHGQYGDYGYYSGRRLKRGEHQNTEDEYYGRSINREGLILEPSSDSDVSGNYPSYEKCPPVDNIVVTVTETRTITKLVNPSKATRQQSGSTRSRVANERRRNHVAHGNTATQVADKKVQQTEQEPKPAHTDRRADILRSRSRSRYNPNNDAY